MKTSSFIESLLINKFYNINIIFIIFISFTAIAQSDWAPQNSGTTNDLYSVTWTGVLFVAVGDSGIIITSPDGVTWEKEASGISKIIRSVCWSGNQLVAVGGYSCIITSPDGIQWTQRNVDSLLNAWGVVWAGDRFLAVGTKIFTSSDGILWDAVFKSDIASYMDIAYNGKKYVAVNDAGWLATSSNGMNWEESFDLSANAITCMDSLFVAIIGHLSYTSTDGSSWNTGEIYTPGCNIYSRSFFGHSIIWTGSLLVCVTSFNKIFTSTDAITWTLEKDSVRLNELCFSEDKFVAVGENGIIYTSPRDVNIAKTPNSIKNNHTVLLRLHGNKLNAILPLFYNGKSIDIEIYSISGKQIFKQNSFVTDSRIKCSVENLASGRYTFVVTGGGIQLMKTFCIMH